MPTARERFARLAGRSDPELDLAEGALLIAAEAYPALDVGHYLGQLDALAERARPQLAGTDAVERIGRLIAFLFQQEGFRGNREAYGDPCNSYLNDVLERRTGIPITLSVVYLELARRLGLPAEGVNFPGHFLVRHAGEPDVLVDAFDGRLVDDADCAELLRAAAGPEVVYDRRMLVAASTRHILARVLRNLKYIHAQRGELKLALGCSERILMLLPDEPQELRDRGLIHADLQAFTAARRDLERFLELAPDDPTAEAVRIRLDHIRGQIARLN